MSMFFGTFAVVRPYELFGAVLLSKEMIGLEHHWSRAYQ